MFGQWTAPCPVPEHTAREHCYMYFIWAILQIHVPAGVGTFGFGVCVFWQAIASSLRRAMGDNKSGSDAAIHVVFASMRFVNGQPLPEALQLRDALRERGVHLKIVELTAGADINEEVFESIEHAEAFLVFGTSNYGEKTANPACEPPRLAPLGLSCLSTASHLRVRRCTYYESEYARNAGKKMILLRMIDWNAKFEHLQARVLFGMNELVLSWKEEEPMPPSLPDDIVASLGGGGTAANDL